MSVLMKGYASAIAGHVGSIKRALNDIGWLDEEVIAAGELRQGKPLSVGGMITGSAVFELGRRRSKALPRHFVLALTAQRVVAFRALATGDDNDTDAGPYVVRIRPGECGSWPRAAVRVVDLPEGVQSETGTLELAETVRVPVMTMGGDPNTDELISILSGGAAGSRTGSPKHEARVADRRSLLRASGVDSAGDAQYAADAARGRPDFDLTGWADRRGLSFRGGTTQGGHLSVTCPWSEDVLFNVVRGIWPGGTYGVLCHEVRICANDARGYFRGGQTEGGKVNKAGFAIDALTPIVALPLGGRGERYVKVPYTSAGSRVPHLATLTGLHVARRAERYTGKISSAYGNRGRLTTSAWTSHGSRAFAGIPMRPSSSGCSRVRSARCFPSSRDSASRFGSSTARSSSRARTSCAPTPTSTRSWQLSSSLLSTCARSACRELVHLT